MPARVQLSVVGGPLQGKTFAFDEHDTFIFGRAPDCHAQLPEDNPTASRHHFILEVNPPDARLRDLGSLNGTHVNGKKYGGRTPNETPEEAARRPMPEVDLKDGDAIRVGEMTFNVKVEVLPDATRLAASEVVPEPVARPQPVLCKTCGKDVSLEIGPGRQGDYVCQACQGKAAANPEGLLKALLAQMGARPHKANQLGIPGYELGKMLGQGGMGTVYLARREKDGRNVAIKVMLSKIAVNEQARRGFEREIEVTAGLHHPNCVELLDHGSAGCGFYFVMEFCPGGSVDWLMDERGGTLPLKEAGPIMLQALEGLAFAHDKTIVHRDLKPQNVLLTSKSGGTVKVSDFGLAKSFTKAGFSGMSATGAVAGTYPFMAREQLTNFKYVKPVSDVWSMGAMLYHLLTGQFPRDFKRGADPMEVILRGNIVPVRKRDSSIPNKVADVIDQAVANTPAERYQTAAEFRQALARVL